MHGASPRSRGADGGEEEGRGRRGFGVQVIIWKEPVSAQGAAPAGGAAHPGLLGTDGQGEGGGVRRLEAVQWAATWGPKSRQTPSPSPPHPGGSYRDGLATSASSKPALQTGTSVIHGTNGDQATKCPGNGRRPGAGPPEPKEGWRSCNNHSASTKGLRSELACTTF